MAHIIADRVEETTTTTGQGPFVLAGAVTARREFSAVCAIGDTFYGTIEAVDNSGIPTGDWMTGKFTYSAANQVSLTTFLASNTGSSINFASGVKRIFIDLLALQFNAPAFCARASSQQSGSAGINTKLQFATEIFDTGNAYDSAANYRFTPDVPGYYLINGSAEFQSTLLSDAGLTIYKNGAGLSEASTYTTYSPANKIIQLNVQQVVYMNGSDYVELYGYMGVGTIVFCTYYGNFSACFVRAG